MARTLLDAIALLHQKIANAQAGSSPSLSDVDAKIRAAQLQLIDALKTNPNLLKKMTGTGKPK